MEFGAEVQEARLGIAVVDRVFVDNLVQNAQVQAQRVVRSRCSRGRY